jgi:hypothetical protein
LNCKSCKGPLATDCISCYNNKPSLHILDIFEMKGECLLKCPFNKFDKNGICQECTAPCKNCIDENICLSCI